MSSARRPSARKILAVNDGRGRFTDASERLTALAPQAGVRFVADDFDGDGDQDLMDGADAGLSAVLRKDGSGRFARATAMRLP